MTKLQTKLPRYVFITNFGVYRFIRNIPKDLIAVVGKRCFYQVLGRDLNEALRNYSGALAEFDSLIASYRQEAPVRETVLAMVTNEFGREASLRLARGDVDENLDFALQDLASKVEEDVKPEVASAIYSGVVPVAQTTLADCLKRLLEHKLSGDAERDRLPQNMTDRCVRYCVEALGHKAVYDAYVGDITRQDANAIRDFLLARLKPSSVSRLFNVITASITFVVTEDDLPIRNVFSRMIIKNAGATKDDRLPLSKDDIYELNKVFDAPDDIAALWATLRDTGARLAEIAYLAVGDVDLQNKSVAIRPNSFRSSLKTASSERTIPLSDKALEALQVLRQGKEDDEAIFTRYARPRGSDAASAVCSKRLRKVVKDPKKTLHSLRHSMKDNLRNSGCPEELGKALLGHSDGS
ncbi:MAG: tyrosine-type recombinase/integrase [Paracoccaceae bacterium]|nr:tyrosine-type recombinase/integrase [Paracoccaceae bacterium]